MGWHWGCFFASWAFAAFMSWVWVFAGNNLCDSEAQLRAALWLIGGFGAFAILFGWYIDLTGWRQVHWRGSEVRWRNKMGDQVQQMQDCYGFRWTRWGYLHLKFLDGAILKLDPYTKGALDLVAAMGEQAEIDVLWPEDADVRPYLVSYGEGSGRTWGWVIARSPDEIRAEFRDLAIHDPPPEWNTPTQVNHFGAYKIEGPLDPWLEALRRKDQPSVP
jgi:hypothetical protein